MSDSNSDDEKNTTSSSSCMDKLKKMNPQVKGLVLSAVLFGALSTAQIIYAFIGNSLALLADACAMWVDVVLYITAICVEMIPDHKAQTKRKITLIVSFISMAVLLGLTTKFTVDGIRGISNSVSCQNMLDATTTDKSKLAKNGITTIDEYNTDGTISSFPVDNLDKFGRVPDNTTNNDITIGIGLPWLVNQLEQRSLTPDGMELMKSNLYNGITYTMYSGILPKNVTHDDAGCENLGAGTTCDADDYDVNGRMPTASGTIMIVFGLLGLLIDSGCLLYGVIMPKCKKHKEKQHDTDNKKDDNDDDDDDDDDYDDDSHELNANTMAAYAHVAADLIRSTATIIAAILILTNTGASYADNGASVVANVTIILGCTLGFWEWKSELFEHFELCREEEEAIANPQGAKDLSSTDKALLSSSQGRNEEAAV